MNILYVVDDFPKISESFVINELHELDRRGHDVSVFAVEKSSEDVVHDELAEMDVTVYYGDQPSIGMLRHLLTPSILNPTVLRSALFVDDPRYHARCLHFARQITEAAKAAGGVDLIHAHFATPERLAVTYAAAHLKVPCTVTAHAYEIFRPPSEKRFRRVCSRFDHVITPSEYNRRYLREQIGVDTDISVVPATTSVEKFEPSDGCVSGRLLTVARLVEKKGHEYAVDAVAELVDRGYDVEYHIVGMGEREAFLRQRVRERGVEDRVEFLGHVSDERLERELQEAEVFVLPCVIASDGDRDVAPVALKEAMAAETACVSTTVSAVPEMITHKKDGLLVPPHTTTELADSIEYLLVNQDERRRLAKSGRTTIKERLDISSTVNSLLEVFERVTDAEKHE